MHDGILRIIKPAARVWILLVVLTQSLSFWWPLNRCVRVLIRFVMYGLVSLSWLAVYFHISPLTLEVLGGWLSYWWEIISRTTSLTMNEQEVERRRSWRLILWQQVAAGMKWTETPSGLWLTCVSVQDKWAAPRSLTPLTLPRMGGGAANAVVKKYHKLDNSTASITIFNQVLIRC